MLAERHHPYAKATPTPHRVSRDEYVEELEERVAQLRSLLVDMNQQPPFEWGLTPTQTLLFGALVNRESCTVAYLGDIMADRAGVDAATSQNVSATIWQMRRKLAPFSVEISKAYGAGGYSLDTSTRTKYRANRRDRLDAFLRAEG